MAKLDGPDLHEPLSHVILPLLSIADLCRLACTACTLRQVVHDLPAATWKAAAASHLPQSYIPCSTREQALVLVRKYEACRHNLLRGQCAQQPAAERQFSRFLDSSEARRSLHKTPSCISVKQGTE